MGFSVVQQPEMPPSFQRMMTIRRVDKALGCREKLSKKEDSEIINNSSINEIRET